MRSIMYRQKTELHVVSLYYNTTIGIHWFRISHIH